MQYKKIGRTGIKVSRLCLGTMNFGPNTDENEAFAIMDSALEAGINFFDTANMYGGRNGGYCGWTEEIIGRWFKQGGLRRERVVLATKVFADMQDKADGPNGTEGLSAYKIRRHLEGSLKRLNTDHIELYQMHGYDPEVTWDEIWDTFEGVIQQGKVFYAGSSNFGARHLVYAQSAAEKRNRLGLVCEQHKYNLLYRLPELEVLPATQELGMGLVTYSPLGMGLLSGSLLKGVDRTQRSSKYVGKLTINQTKQLEEYYTICKELGEDPANVAVAWLLASPYVTAPIIGPRTLEQFEGTLRAIDIVLTDEVLKKFDEIFPGPGYDTP